MPSCRCCNVNEDRDAPRLKEWRVALYLGEDQSAVRRNYRPSVTEVRHIDPPLLLPRQVKQPKRRIVANKNLPLAIRQRGIGATRKSSDFASVQTEGENAST